jgi:hypothetical protein
MNPDAKNGLRLDGKRIKLIDEVLAGLVKRVITNRSAVVMRQRQQNLVAPSEHNPVPPGPTQGSSRAATGVLQSRFRHNKDVVAETIDSPPADQGGKSFGAFILVGDLDFHHLHDATSFTSAVCFLPTHTPLRRFLARSRSSKARRWTITR